MVLQLVEGFDAASAALDVIRKNELLTGLAFPPARRFLLGV